MQTTHDEKHGYIECLLYKIPVLIVLLGDILRPIWA
jgi:hypothetical protein